VSDNPAHTHEGDREAPGDAGRPRRQGMDQSRNERRQRRHRLEIWLFLAMLAAGLLGFMSTLSEGDGLGGDELETSVRSQPLLGDQ
jgi:type VI protein secretion system component VasF